MGAKLIDSYFKMEMCKLEEVEKIKDSQLICDFCDVQSARSDSCVSDEEYPEVYSFTRAKKKLHNVVSVSVSKKERLRSNTTIQKSTTRERDSVKTMKSGVNLLPIQMKSDKIAKRIVLNE